MPARSANFLRVSPLARNQITNPHRNPENTTHLSFPQINRIRRFPQEWGCSYAYALGTLTYLDVGLRYEAPASVAAMTTVEVCATLTEDPRSVGTFSITL
jgi:hypothetical protein